jgi:hypothetical protein
MKGRENVICRLKALRTKTANHVKVEIDRGDMYIWAK